MPTIRDASKMTVVGGDGWRETVVADHDLIAAPAMVAWRVQLTPGAERPSGPAVAGAVMVYVIAGAGLASVGADTFPLEPESVLWLEPGERLSLAAGEEGLDLLLGQAA